jgi:hypothetical protein
MPFAHKDDWKLRHSGVAVVDAARITRLPAVSRCIGLREDDLEY